MEKTELLDEIRTDIVKNNICSELRDGNPDADIDKCGRLNLSMKEAK